LLWSHDSQNQLAFTTPKPLSCPGQPQLFINLRNEHLAAKPDTLADGAVQQLGGPSWYGQIAVVSGIVLCVVLGLTTRAEN